MRIAANLAVGLAVLFLTVPAAAQQQPQQQTQQQPQQQPMDKAIKLANIAGVYIGMMENCKADTGPIRNHYWNRIAKLSRTDDGQAHAIFEGAIQRSKREAATYKDAPADACEKTRAAKWTEFQKVIDGLIDGKGRF